MKNLLRIVAVMLALAAGVQAAHAMVVGKPIVAPASRGDHPGA